MIRYSLELRRIEYVKKEKIVLVGNNNWKVVKVFYFLLLIICIFIIFLLFTCFELSSIVIRFFIIAPLTILSVISINILFDYREQDSLLSFLKINREEIRLNPFKDVKREIRIKNDSIDSIQILINGKWQRKPIFKFYLNNQKKPFAEFKYLVDDRFNVRNTIEKFTSILNLKVNRSYQLDNSRVILEYIKNIDNSIQDKNFKLNFNIIETSSQLIIESIANSKKRVEIDFNNGILTSKYSPNYTYKIELDKILQYKKEVKTELITKDGNKVAVTSFILLEVKNKRKDIKILSSQIKTKYPWDMLEFESHKELDLIINRLDKLKE